MSARCGWVLPGDALYEAYHDAEWGVPCADDSALFELLMLEGFQAGLAWITVLRKRDAFRAAFDGFEPVRIASYGEADIERLLANPGIVRSRAKIEAVIAGARIFSEMAARGERFSHLIWGFVDGRPVQNAWRSFRDGPTSTPASAALSKELKRRGFKFCGPVICYAYMQAAGLVNDHETACPRHDPVRALGETFAL